MSVETKLSPDEQSELINILKIRFEKNSVRHENINWENVQKKLEFNPEKLWSLNEMEPKASRMLWDTIKNQIKKPSFLAEVVTGVLKPFMKT